MEGFPSNPTQSALVSVPSRFYVFLPWSGELCNLPNNDTVCHHREVLIRTYSDIGKNKHLHHWCHAITNNILILTTRVQNNTHVPAPEVTDDHCHHMPFPFHFLATSLLSFLASASAYLKDNTVNITAQAVGHLATGWHTVSTRRPSNQPTRPVHLAPSHLTAGCLWSRAVTACGSVRDHRAWPMGPQ